VAPPLQLVLVMPLISIIRIKKSKKKKKRNTKSKKQKEEKSVALIFQVKDEIKVPAGCKLISKLTALI
jgi:hypothetical protein